MDKTEILKQLEELRKIFMGIKLRKNSNSNNQIKEIATYYDTVEKTKKEIADLEKKLETEDAYKIKPPIFSDNDAYNRHVLSKSLRTNEEEQRNNAFKISAIQRRLGLIPDEIKLAQDMQSQNHAELENIQKSAIIQNPELKEQVRIRTEACRDYIQSISNAITSLNNEKDSLSRELERLELRQLEIPEAISRQKEALAQFDEAHQAPKETVDREAIQKDRDQLYALKAVLDSYGLQKLSLTYNFVEAIYDLTNRYRSLRVNDTELQHQLEDFKRLLPDEVSTYGAKNRREKIKQNQVSQQYCVTEIATLTEKLQNKDNYRNISSYLEGQRNIMDMMQNLMQMKNDIDKDTLYMSDLLRQIEYEKAKVDASDELEKMYIGENVQLRILLATVVEGSKEDTQIRENILKCEKLVNEHRKYKESALEHKASLENLVLEIEKKVMMAKKSYAVEDRRRKDYVKSLERKSDINQTAVRMDEEKLERLKNDLESLKNREFFLSQSDPRIKINTILDDLNKKMKNDAAKKTAEPTGKKNPDSKKVGKEKEPAKKKKEKSSEKPLIAALVRLLPGKQKVDAYIPQPEHIEEQVKGKTLKDTCIAIRDRFFTTKSWSIQDVKEQDSRGKIVDAEFSPIEEPIIEAQIASEEEGLIVPPVEEPEKPVVEEDVVPEKEEPNIPQEKKEEESTKPSNTPKLSIIDSTKVTLYTKASEFLNGKLQNETFQMEHPSAAKLFSKIENWSYGQSQKVKMLNRPFILDKLEPGTLAKVFGKPVSEENAEDKLPKKPKEAVKKSDEEPVKDAPVFFGRGAGIGMPIPKRIQEPARKFIEGLKELQALRESLKGDTNIMDAEFVVVEDTTGRGMGHGK